MTSTDPGRLRPPPRERFTGDTLAFDLDQVFDELASESFHEIDGHHQIALFKDGNSTVIAFLFDTDGYLPDHQADGFVTIQVIEGRLNISTPDEEYDLGTGGLLLFRPGVPHDVLATEPSKMLLTVHLER